VGIYFHETSRLILYKTLHCGNARENIGHYIGVTGRVATHKQWRDEMNSPNSSTTAKSAKNKRTKLAAILGAASLVAVGTFATVAYSSGGSYAKEHKMGGLMHGAGDPAKFEKKLDKKMKFFAFALDATDEQQAKLKTVILALAKEVRPMKAKMYEAREQLHTLLSQTKIDRGAIENLRAEKIAMIDTMSRKVSAAIADAGEILSPEQRLKLVKFMQNFKPHGRGWKRS